MDGLCHFEGPKIRCLDMDLMNLVKWVKENSTWIKANNGFVKRRHQFGAMAGPGSSDADRHRGTQVDAGGYMWMQIDEGAWCQCIVASKDLT